MFFCLRCWVWMVMWFLSESGLGRSVVGVLSMMSSLIFLLVVFSCWFILSVV